MEFPDRFTSGDNATKVEQGVHYKGANSGRSAEVRRGAAINDRSAARDGVNVFQNVQDCSPEHRDPQHLIVDVNKDVLSDLLLSVWSELQQAAYRQTRGHKLSLAGRDEAEELHEGMELQS